MPAISIAEFHNEFVRKAIRARCLCGSHHGVPVLRRDRYGIPIVPLFCRSCGHVYARNRLNGDDLDRFYATSLYRSLYANPHRLTSVSKTEAKIAWSESVLWPMFERFVGESRDRVVVEWGASAGWNLIPFQRRGVRSVGFDLDPEYIAHGRQSFGLDLRDIGATGNHMDGLAPDFLILNHVLEHVINPIGLLRDLSRSLKPGGVIFVGLPFLENIRDWGFRNYFHIAHLHYFSRPYFEALAAREGFAALYSDDRRGFVVLKPAPPNPTVRVDFRMRNLGLLVKQGMRHVVTGLPQEIGRAAVRHVPVLHTVLRRFAR